MAQTNFAYIFFVIVNFLKKLGGTFANDVQRKNFLFK